MATLASLVVMLGMDSTGLSAGAAKAEGTLAGVGASAKSSLGAVVPLAAAAAGFAVVKFAGDAIDAASDLEESTNKVRVVFGDSANQIIDWSKTTSDAFGISQQAALESAGTFGNLFDAMGLADTAGAEMSTTLVELSADLASFNNASPEDVLAAMQSGLTGQIRPLRQYGIEISEAALKQEALSQGITKSTSEMTMAEKVQLRYALILKQTGNAQGDFARTSEGLANQQRILKAEFLDLEATVGGALLPAAKEVVSAFSDIAKDAGPLLVIAFKLIGEAAAGVAEQVSLMTGTLGQLISVIPGLNAAADEGSKSWLDWASSASKFTISLPSTAFWTVLHTGVDMFTTSADEAAEATRGWTADTSRLAASARAYQAVAETGIDITDKEAIAAREAAEAYRDQRLAVLALSDKFLGIADSANQVSEAQRTLNELEKHGREDTKAYEQAVLDALEAQISLEDSVLSYGKDLADSGETARDVKEKIRDLGSQFGLQDKTIQDLIRRIQEYINHLNNIPTDIMTNVRVSGGGAGGVQLQHGGIVTRPTMALVGEAGPEAVIPLGKGLGGPAINITVNGWVGSETKLRNELLKLSRRNGTTGIL